LASFLREVSAHAVGILVAAPILAVAAGLAGWFFGWWVKAWHAAVTAYEFLHGLLTSSVPTPAWVLALLVVLIGALSYAWVRARPRRSPPLPEMSPRQVQILKYLAAHSGQPTRRGDLHQSVSGNPLLVDQALDALEKSRTRMAAQGSGYGTLGLTKTGRDYVIEGGYVR
jgi:hypothetical protein